MPDLYSQNSIVVLIVIVIFLLMCLVLVAKVVLMVTVPAFKVVDLIGMLLVILTMLF